MKALFALLPEADKKAAYAEAAQRTGVLPVIVEKDFWVCWLLGRIFATEELSQFTDARASQSAEKRFTFK